MRQSRAKPPINMQTPRPPLDAAQTIETYFWNVTYSNFAALSLRSLHPDSDAADASRKVLAYHHS